MAIKMTYPGCVLCRVEESCARWRQLLNSLGNNWLNARWHEGMQI
jgi:hypothetical protein